MRDFQVPRIYQVNLEQFPALLQAGDACYARVKYNVPYPHMLPKS